MFFFFEFSTISMHGRLITYHKENYLNTDLTTMTELCQPKLQQLNVSTLYKSFMGWDLICINSFISHAGFISLVAVRTVWFTALSRLPFTGGTLTVGLVLASLCKAGFSYGVLLSHKCPFNLFGVLRSPCVLQRTPYVLLEPTNGFIIDKKWILKRKIYFYEIQNSKK